MKNTKEERKDKVMESKYKHICFKCSKKFVIYHEIDTDKPTCNDCFEKLKKINNVKDYYEFIKGRKESR